MLLKCCTENSNWNNLINDFYAKVFTEYSVLYVYTVRQVADVALIWIVTLFMVVEEERNVPF